MAPTPKTPFSSANSSTVPPLNTAQSQDQLNSLVRQITSNPQLLQVLAQAAPSSSTGTAAFNPPKRVKYTEEHKQDLEQMFKRSPHPSAEEKRECVQKTGLTNKQVTRSFQNQRALPREATKPKFPWSLQSTSAAGSTWSRFARCRTPIRTNSVGL
ncbi:hypothetical protein L596_018010 [Steinernema carpocapsae]|uniref:Homeobox domain-containing protein n=1 Tax=Steinernema carpocapsae TaxID=34508 RepID=A0A4U5N3S3_STECR|nr:hypothetical protein L596_018010 [Steinernema carpocapsae]